MKMMTHLMTKSSVRCPTLNLFHRHKLMGLPSCSHHIQDYNPSTDYRRNVRLSPPYVTIQVCCVAVHHVPGVLAPQAGGRENRQAIAAYIDGSPSKGRVHKALKASTDGARVTKTQIGSHGHREALYESVVDKASKLFIIIRQSVVSDLAPSALKSSFLDPLHSSLFSEVRAHVQSNACLFSSSL